MIYTNIHVSECNRQNLQSIVKLQNQWHISVSITSLMARKHLSNSFYLRSLELLNAIRFEIFEITNGNEHNLLTQFSYNFSLTVQTTDFSRALTFLTIKNTMFVYIHTSHKCFRLDFLLLISQYPNARQG